MAEGTFANSVRPRRKKINNLGVHSSQKLGSLVRSHRNRPGLVSLPLSASLFPNDVVSINRKLPRLPVAWTLRQKKALLSHREEVHFGSQGVSGPETKDKERLGAWSGQAWLCEPRSQRARRQATLPPCLRVVWKGRKVVGGRRSSPAGSACPGSREDGDGGVSGRWRAQTSESDTCARLCFAIKCR